MATQRVKPQDYTGSQRAKLAAQHAEAVKAREHEISMVTAAEAELDDAIHDVVGNAEVTQTAEDGTVTYVEAPARTIRLNTAIEKMTFGIGNNYDFEEGKLYRVPAAVADHLEELGYVWH